MSDAYDCGDIYQAGSASYPPSGGVGSDIIWESIQVYSAANNQSFSNTGEWFAGSALCPFDKENNLLGCLIGSVPDPTAQIALGIYDWNTGALLARTNKFTAVVGLPTAFLTAPLQTNKGVPYFLAIWSEKNVIMKYDNGLQSVGSVNYGYRGTSSDLPANLFLSGAVSPVYPFVVSF